MADFALLKGLLFGIIAAAAVMGLMREDGTTVPITLPHGSQNASTPQNQDSTITRGVDGHFWVDAEVNGETIRFLIDTGASHVILTPADAEKLQLDLIADDYTVRYSTANGQIAAAPITLDHIDIGTISVDNVIAAVNDRPMPHSLLGMSFLSRLSHFNVNGDRLTLSQ